MLERGKIENQDSYFRMSSASEEIVVAKSSFRFMALQIGTAFSLLCVTRTNCINKWTGEM